jgi:hypothetical protein
MSCEGEKEGIVGGHFVKWVLMFGPPEQGRVSVASLLSMDGWMGWLHGGSFDVTSDNALPGRLVGFASLHGKTCRLCLAADEMAAGAATRPAPGGLLAT